MRHKDYDWNLPAGTPAHEWVSIHAALLMDIRDELKALNRVVAWPNFTGLPATLKTSSRKLTKPRRKRVTR